jgi:hypothetical protein
VAALHSKGEDIQTKALLEAFASAEELVEPNRVVTVSAWPVKVLSLLGKRTELVENTRRLLSVIAQEDSPVRRSDALRELFGAVISGDHSLATLVTRAFVDSCSTPLNGGRRNRKGEYLLEECVPAIARIDPQSALRVLAQLPVARAERARKVIIETQDILLAYLVIWPHVT